MAKILPTKDRNLAGLHEKRIGIDKTRGPDPFTGIERDFILIKETLITDDDGNITGVLREWQ